MGRLVVGLLLLSVAPSSSQAVRRPIYGGTLRVGTLTGVGAVAPGAALTRVDWMAVGAVHAGLYRFAPSGRAAPDLLARGLQGPDRGTRWNAQLRRDARFHDGRIPRSRDVLAAVVGLRGTPHEWLGRLIRIELVDDFTFRLRTSEPMDKGALERLLASPSLAIPREGTEGRVGAGPFAVSSWQRINGTLSLARHAEHHHGTSYLDKLVFSPHGTRDQVVQAFVYGKVDLVLEDSSRYHGVTRLDGPAMETIGILVSARTAAAGEATRRAVLAAAASSDLAQRIPGRTRAATHWVPKARKSGEVPSGRGRPGARWFLGVSSSLSGVGPTLAAALGTVGKPWPTQPVDPAGLRRILVERRPGRWDAILLRWSHVHDWPRAALESLVTISGAPRGRDPNAILRRHLSWLPLVDVSPTAVFATGLKGVHWTPDGVLRLDVAWRP